MALGKLSGSTCSATKSCQLTKISSEQSDEIKALILAWFPSSLATSTVISPGHSIEALLAAMQVRLGRRVKGIPFSVKTFSEMTVRVQPVSGVHKK